MSWLGLKLTAKFQWWFKVGFWCWSISVHELSTWVFFLLLCFWLTTTFHLRWSLNIWKSSFSSSCSNRLCEWWFPFSFGFFWFIHILKYYIGSLFDGILTNLKVYFSHGSIRLKTLHTKALALLDVCFVVLNIVPRKRIKKTISFTINLQKAMIGIASFTHKMISFLQHRAVVVLVPEDRVYEVLGFSFKVDINPF